MPLVRISISRVWLDRGVVLKTDLHIHTTVSDGTSTPRQVVQIAAKRKLRAIAITDHDTVGGIEEAKAEGLQSGVEVIPGVEINTDYNHQEIHILGYFIRFKDRQFLAHLDRLQNARVIRIEKMVNRLPGLGLPVKLKRVLELAGAGSVGRPHIGMAMVEKGYVTSIQEAFQRYLGLGRPAFVPRFALTPAEAVGIIRQAGGVAVWAHPGLAKHDYLLAELIGAGLRGLEVYYPEHTPEMVRHYLALARQHRLVVTGGSDYHGSGTGYRAELGEVTVAYEAVEQLRQSLN